MTEDERDDLLARAGELNEKLDEVPFDKVLEQYKSQRSLVVALLAVVIALFVVVCALTVVTVQVRRNAHDIATVQDVFIANCESGNEFRAGLDELFAPLLTDAPPATPRTPAQQDQFDAFKATADRIFKQRDCSELPATPAQP